MAHNTDDCKEYLVKHYPHTKKSEWKRVRKYKDNLGNECRDFNNTGYTDYRVEKPLLSFTINNI